MERMITAGVRILACGFFFQPVLVAIVIVPCIEGKLPAFLYVILGVTALACIAIGVAVWKFAPKFFIGILNRMKASFKKNT